MGEPFVFKSLAVTYSHMANATLPSALVRFTSEFGMGSGGTTPLLPPGKPVCKGNLAYKKLGLCHQKI